MDFSNLTGKELYSDEVIAYVMDEEDPLIREQLGFDLLDRAAVFGDRIEKRVERMLKIAEKDRASKERERKKASPKNFDRYTDFGERYPAMKCGAWVADLSGVYNPDAMPDNRLACPHPILPAEVITNVEDGTQKVKIAFKRSGKWQEHIVPKVVVANRSKIPELAGVGVAVTSETAKSLVRYLAEVEQLNLEVIPEIRATAKMGWCEDGFMPYSSDLAFDKDGRFDGLFDTLNESGSKSKWFDFVKELRNGNRIEPRLVLAASFASVLIKPCGLLPFWVDIWGRTGGGKSVCGMLAASVWADPEIGKYISKFDSTISAFEARAGFLNHLPFVIDDTAEIRKRMKDDFSQLIYQLASGEGRERSNTKLGLAHKTTWNNVIICSGESPIITEQLQGGAVNRVLEYEVDDGDIFEDGQAAAATLKSNFGFAGKLFVESVLNIGLDKVAEMQQETFKAIKSDEYEDKQLRSLSALLVADRIATDTLFKDDIYLQFADVERCLTNKNTLSENERCYEYVLGECAINENKFVPGGRDGDYLSEVWGKYFKDKSGTECIAIITNVFRRICLNGGFSSKAFLSWAEKKGVLLTDGRGCPSKTVSLCNEKKQKCYVLALPKEILEPEFDDEEF